MEVAVTGIRIVSWLLSLVLILIVGACSTSEDDADAGASSASTMPPPDGLSELIDDYLVSWETKDEPALRAAVTDDFVVHEYFYMADTGKRYEVIDDDADGIVSEGWEYDWQNAIVGESVVTGNGPWTVRHRELWQQAGERFDGIATFTVVDVDGTLMIARHSWAGFTWWESIEF
jgi:hypothetical protein